MKNWLSPTLSPLVGDGIDLVIRVVCRARGIERRTEVEQESTEDRATVGSAFSNLAVKDRLLANNGGRWQESLSTGMIPDSRQTLQQRFRAVDRLRTY